MDETRIPPEIEIYEKIPSNHPHAHISRISQYLNEFFQKYATKMQSEHCLEIKAKIEEIKKKLD